MEAVFLIHSPLPLLAPPWGGALRLRAPRRESGEDREAQPLDKAGTRPTQPDPTEPLTATISSRQSARSNSKRKDLG